MNMLTSNGKKLINYNNVECLTMYETDNGMWRIQAICTSGEYDVLTQPGTEQECQNEFDRLCDKISKCREHDTIDLGDL